MMPLVPDAELEVGYPPGAPLTVQDYRLKAEPTSWSWTADDGGAWVNPFGYVIDAAGGGDRDGSGEWWGYPDWTIAEPDGGRIGPHRTAEAARGAFTMAAVRHVAAVSASARLCRWCEEPFARRAGETLAGFMRRRYCSASCGEQAARPSPSGDRYASRRERDYCSITAGSPTVRRVARRIRERWGA